MYQVENIRRNKVEEFYVDDVVRAPSQVAAISTVAKESMNGHNYKSFMWTRLTVTELSEN